MGELKRRSRTATVACGLVAIMNVMTGIASRSERLGYLYFYIAVMWLLIGFLMWGIIKAANTPTPRLDAWQVLAEYRNHTMHVCGDGLLVCEKCDRVFEDSVKFDAHAMRIALSEEDEPEPDDTWLQFFRLMRDAGETNEEKR